MTKKTKEDKNVFRYLWESLAYLQAFFDDTILYTIHKLQDQAEKETDIDKKKKIHEKIIWLIGTWLSASIWEAWAGFYEKYADLKKWDNLAETAIEEDLPRMMKKGKMIVKKMEKLSIKKWDLKWLRRLAWK